MSDQIEGVYASPIHPAAVDHLVAVVDDLVSRYALDGIHLDYVRFRQRTSTTAAARWSRSGRRSTRT